MVSLFEFFFPVVIALNCVSLTRIIENNRIIIYALFFRLRSSFHFLFGFHARPSTACSSSNFQGAYIMARKLSEKFLRKCAQCDTVVNAVVSEVRFALLGSDENFDFYHNVFHYRPEQPLFAHKFNATI